MPTASCREKLSPKTHTPMMTAVTGSKAPMIAAGVLPMRLMEMVDIFSHRLQVQERMTLQIKECIQETLNPLGVMVVVEAKHMCMQMRGVEKQNSVTTTSDFTGAFNQAKTREEFMNLIRAKY